MGYNGRLSLNLLEKSVKVENLPCPLLRGQPLKVLIGKLIDESLIFHQRNKTANAVINSTILEAFYRKYKEVGLAHSSQMKRNI